MFFNTLNFMAFMEIAWVVLNSACLTSSVFTSSMRFNAGYLGGGRWNRRRKMLEFAGVVESVWLQRVKMIKIISFYIQFTL